jgi:hypothetical protein
MGTRGLRPAACGLRPAACGPVSRENHSVVDSTPARPAAVALREHMREHHSAVDGGSKLSASCELELELEFLALGALGYPWPWLLAVLLAAGCWV